MIQISTKIHDLKTALIFLIDNIHQENGQKSRVKWSIRKGPFQIGHQPSITLRRVNGLFCLLIAVQFLMGVINWTTLTQCNFFVTEIDAIITTKTKLTQHENYMEYR